MMTGRYNDNHGNSVVLLMDYQWCGQEIALHTRTTLTKEASLMEGGFSACRHSAETIHWVAGSKPVLFSGQCGQTHSRKLLSELAKTDHTAHWSAQYSFVTITGPEAGTSL